MTILKTNYQLNLINYEAQLLTVTNASSYPELINII